MMAEGIERDCTRSAMPPVRAVEYEITHLEVVEGDLGEVDVGGPSSVHLPVFAVARTQLGGTTVDVVFYRLAGAHREAGLLFRSSAMPGFCRAVSDQVRDDEETRSGVAEGMIACVCDVDPAAWSALPSLTLHNTAATPGLETEGQIELSRSR